MKLSGRIGRIKPSATLAINAKANELKRNGVRIINFGVGEPDFDTPQNIRNAGMESISRGLTRYTAVGGINELKDAVCSTIRADYGLPCGRENVLISCGGKHALYNLFMTLLDPGDEVIVPSPYWVSYPDMINLANAKPVVVPCSEKDGFILRPEALEKAITPKTRLLILNSPSNPTGKYYGHAELKALAEVLLRHENVLVASDDIYYRILFGGRKWVSLGMVEERLRDRIFTINGVSKSYCMTGWRIGFLIGDPAVIKAATDFQSQVTSNAASISQWASVEALSGDQKPAMEMAQIFEVRCTRVMEIIAGLPDVTCAPPDGAFYVFPNFSAYFGRKFGARTINGSLDLADFLMEEGHVAVVPGEAFGEDNCIRFSYALSDEEIEQGFDAVKRALEKLS
ncbi:MAG: pyridoxal phosphate-dependent aminotransferase [Deltaproteobacteria bacterium]|jgi:aspartate aminotransferase|nr:pyridoxal phosphate-dependent aminotransferase [Deltaproteobacteria bacterium]MDA8307129.1 pyridoxal phosphate-dependent aminotransferase [Deltaproteobacteria bacterium]